MAFVKGKTTLFKYFFGMSFRENLREAIDFCGLQQKELAYKVKIPLRSIENYLRDNASIPSADKAVQIAQALGVTVEYLVTGKNTHFMGFPSVGPEIQDFIRNINKLSKNKQHIVIQNALNLIGFLSQPNKSD